MRFVALLNELQAALEPVEPDNPDGRADYLLEYFWDESRRESFFQKFKDLQMAYEVLSPDPFLYDYIRPYAELADIYATVRSYFDPQAEKRRLEGELLQETDKLIREQVEVAYVAEPLPLYPINRNIADVIDQDSISERVKVINLQRSITTHVDDNIERAPYLAGISDEVERILALLHDKQISVQTALDELTAKANEIVTRDEERATSSLDDLAFALSTSLRWARLPGVSECRGYRRPGRGGSRLPAGARRLDPQRASGGRGGMTGPIQASPAAHGQAGQSAGRQGCRQCAAAHKRNYCHERHHPSARSAATWPCA